jgi:hypothetical protein
LPSFANAIAKLAAIKLLPTPPFPLAIGIIVLFIADPSLVIKSINQIHQAQWRQHNQEKT